MDENKKIQIGSKEFEKRVKEMKKKQLGKRVVFVGVVILILLIVFLIIFGIVSLIKSIIRNRQDADYGADTTELVGPYIENADSVYYSDDLFFTAGNSSIQCLTRKGTPLWEYCFNGEKVSCVAENGKALVYAIGGNELLYFGKTGPIWKLPVDGEINYACINEKTKTGVCCYNTNSDKAAVCVFDYSKSKADSDVLLDNDIPSPEELLLKTYKTGYVISAALSPDGKTLAIGELSQSNSVAATKLSLITIKTGKNFFTKVFEKEVCPYISFCGNSRVIAASNKNVYSVEIVTSGASSKVNKVCSFEGENSAVLGVAIASEKLAVVGGNEAGTALLYIYDLAKGSQKVVTDHLDARGVVAAGDYFAMYTDGYVHLVDTSGKVVGTSAKFAVVEEVFSSNTLNLVVKDATNISVLEFVK